MSSLNLHNIIDCIDVKYSIPYFLTKSLWSLCPRSPLILNWMRFVGGRYFFPNEQFLCFWILFVLPLLLG